MTKRPHTVRSAPDVAPPAEDPAPLEMLEVLQLPSHERPPDDPPPDPEDETLELPNEEEAMHVTTRPRQ